MSSLACKNNLGLENYCLTERITNCLGSMIGGALSIIRYVVRDIRQDIHRHSVLPYRSAG